MWGSGYLMGIILPVTMFVEDLNGSYREKFISQMGKVYKSNEVLIH